METNDLIKYQLEASGHQVDKVLEGMGEAHWGGKLRDGCMSPAETVAHLTECYVAVQKDLAGQKHEWGSYIPKDDAPSALTAEMRAERERACAAIAAAGDESALKSATQYILLHDAYHVGQLATYRMGADPEWDAYSIYS